MAEVQVVQLVAVQAVAAVVVAAQAQAVADQFTLEAVGRQSGFASKSSFFTAFREAEGMTPHQFVDRVKHGEKV